MNRAFWETVSANYQQEVLSVFDNDAEGLVKKRIADAAVSFPKGNAVDLGCGVGRFTPLLADSFSHVYACDFSSVALKRARSRCRNKKNVTYCEFDLTGDPAPFDPVEFVLCVNVLIMPSLAQRLRAWRAVTNQVKHGGTLLLVVPSMESAQMEHYRTVESWLGEGETCAAAIRNSIQEKATASDLRMGIYQLDGVRTKHYLREEIQDVLCGHEFEIDEFRKLRYPPDGDESPFETWDWLFVARRR